MRTLHIGRGTVSDQNREAREIGTKPGGASIAETHLGERSGLLATEQEEAYTEPPGLKGNSSPREEVRVCASPAACSLKKLGSSTTVDTVEE